MFKKALVGLMLASLMGLSMLTVHAQDVITVDEPVTGEITNEDYSLFYSYVGKKDDVTVIEMKPVDPLGDLDIPAIIIRDPKGRDLVRTDGYAGATMITVLPVDGEYTIIATRSDDAAGESVGEFTLTVSTAKDLKVGDTITGEINSDSNAYYVYRQKDDFTLSFTHEGEFSPSLSLNTINDEYSPGTLNSLFTVEGDLNIAYTLGPIPSDDLYIIKMGKALFDFNFTPIDASYTLAIGEAPSK